jgi:pectate lyase-like protein
MAAGGSSRRGNSQWTPPAQDSDSLAGRPSTNSSRGLIAAEFLLKGILTLVLFGLIAMASAQTAVGGAFGARFSLPVVVNFDTHRSEPTSASAGSAVVRGGSSNANSPATGKLDVAKVPEPRPATSSVPWSSAAAASASSAPTTSVARTSAPNTRGATTAGPVATRAAAPATAAPSTPARPSATIAPTAALTTTGVPTPAPSASSPPSSVPPVVPSPTAAPSATVPPTVAPTAGNAYYLSPSGNDTNSGTATDPWRTFCKANDMVAPGDTVHVLPGTYQQEPMVAGLCDPGGSFLAGIYLGRGGNAAARVTYISDTKWGALVRSSGRGIAVRVGGPYIDFIGFDVSIGTGERAEPNGALYAGIYVTGSGARVIGNRVHDLPLDFGCGNFGGGGIVLGYSPASAAASTRGQVADGNWINNTGTASNCSPSLGEVHGIYAQTIGVKIRNNILYHNVGGYGLALNHCYSAAEISNNLFFDNGSSAIVLSADLEPGCSRNTGTRVNNNIIRSENQHSLDYGVIRDQSGGADSAVNNLFWSIGAQPRTSGLAESGSIVADPLMGNFRSDGTGDYRLTADSPAVDRGTSVIAPPTDFGGKARPSGPAHDIGPFEF